MFVHSPLRENTGSVFLFIIHACDILFGTWGEKFLKAILGSGGFQHASKVLFSVVKFSESLSCLVLLHTACSRTIKAVPCPDSNNNTQLLL